MKKITIVLGIKQKKRLEELYRTTNNGRLKERYQALLLSSDGYLPEEIKKIVRRNVQTVRSWLRAYQRAGLPALKVGHGPGRPSTISQRQKQSLIRVVCRSPRFSGYSFNIWTCKNLGVFLNQRFNIQLSAERIRQILHREEVVMKNPAYLYAKQNPKKKKAFC